MLFRPWLLSPQFYSYFLDKEETGDLPGVFFLTKTLNPRYFLSSGFEIEKKKVIVLYIRSRYRNVNAKLVKKWIRFFENERHGDLNFGFYFPAKKGPSTGTHYLVISQNQSVGPVCFQFS